MTRRLPFIWLLLLFTPVSPAAAQGGELGVDVGVSHALAPSGSVVDAATYVLGGLRLERRVGARASLFASVYGAGGLDSESGDWGSAALGGRLSLPLPASFGLDVDLVGSAFTVGEPFSYRAASGEALPRLRWRKGRFEAFLGGRGGLAGSRVVVPEGTDGDGGGPGIPPPVPDGPGGSPARAAGVTANPQLTAGAGERSVVSDLWYYGGGPGVRFVTEAIAVEAAVEAFESETGDYRMASLGLRGRVAGLEWSADVSVWDTPNLGEEVTGGVTFRVPLGGPWSLGGSGGRSRPDPLLAIPAAGFGTGRVSRTLVRFGPDYRAEREPRLYRVLEGDAGPGGAGLRTVRFTLRRAGAESVSVLGGFTGWEEVPMRREGGLWVAELTVRPGTYHFGFRVDGEWYVPEDAPGRVDDEWGRTNATLVVSGR